MTKHTAGPWEVTNWGQVASVTTHNRALGIATVNAYGDTTKGIPSAEDTANARLIAAAPDMLAALRMAMETCDNVADAIAAQHQEQTKEARWLNEVVAVTRSAIAKATGAE